LENVFHYRLYLSSLFSIHWMMCAAQVNSLSCFAWKIHYFVTVGSEITQTVEWTHCQLDMWDWVVTGQDYSFCHSVQTSPRYHLESYTIVTKVLPSVKWPGHETNHSLLPSAKIRNVEHYLHVPICLHGVVLV
jgi:hypothetical protein